MPPMSYRPSVVRLGRVLPYGAAGASINADRTATDNASHRMARVTILIAVLVAIVLLAVLGGCLYLAYGNFPAQRTTVEKVLPDARFPK